MKQYETVQIQPRTNRVAVSWAGEWLVILDLSSGQRIRVHKDYYESLSDALFDAHFEIKKQSEEEDV